MNGHRHDYLALSWHSYLGSGEKEFQRPSWAERGKLGAIYPVCSFTSYQKNAPGTVVVSILGSKYIISFNYHPDLCLMYVHTQCQKVPRIHYRALHS